MLVLCKACVPLMKQLKKHLLYCVFEPTIGILVLSSLIKVRSYMESVYTNNGYGEWNDFEYWAPQGLKLT